MTIAINFETVVNSIADLDIAGVTIYHPDNAPTTGSKAKLPCLVPQGENFVDDDKDERMSFGGGGTASMDYSYRLNYVYLHSPATAGIDSLQKNLMPMLKKVFEIVETILSNDDITGAVDMKLDGIPTRGVIQHPDGGEYWGAMISLRILEQIQ